MGIRRGAPERVEGPSIRAPSRSTAARWSTSRAPDGKPARLRSTPAASISRSTGKGNSASDRSTCPEAAMARVLGPLNCVLRNSASPSKRVFTNPVLPSKRAPVNRALRWKCASPNSAPPSKRAPTNRAPPSISALPNQASPPICASVNSAPYSKYAPTNHASPSTRTPANWAMPSKCAPRNPALRSKCAPVNQAWPLKCASPNPATPSKRALVNRACPRTFLPSSSLSGSSSRSRRPEPIVVPETSRSLPGPRLARKPSKVSGSRWARRVSVPAAWIPRQSSSAAQVSQSVVIAMGLV